MVDIPVSPAFRGKGGRTKGSRSSSATIYQYEASLDYTGPCLRTKQHTKKKKSLNISYCATCYSWVFVRKNEQNGAHTFWWELRWPWNFSLEGFLPTRLGCPSFPVNQHVSKPATATWKKWRQLLQGLIAVGKARVTDKMLVQQRCCTSDLSSGLFFFFFTKWAILPLPPLSWGYRCVT